jgi:hypothetical protein
MFHRVTPDPPKDKLGLTQPEQDEGRNTNAEGMGASGIGCFLDDPLHELLGLEGSRLQALYMFTVGPVPGHPGRSGLVPAS